MDNTNMNQLRNSVSDLFDDMRLPRNKSYGTLKLSRNQHVVFSIGKKLIKITAVSDQEPEAFGRWCWKYLDPVLPSNRPCTFLRGKRNPNWGRFEISFDPLFPYSSNRYHSNGAIDQNMVAQIAESINIIVDQWKLHGERLYDFIADGQGRADEALADVAAVAEIDEGPVTVQPRLSTEFVSLGEI